MLRGSSTGNAVDLLGRARGGARRLGVAALDEWLSRRGATLLVGDEERELVGWYAPSSSRYQLGTCAVGVAHVLAAPHRPG